MSNYDEQTRSFVQWDGDLEAMYASGGILTEAANDGPSNAEAVPLVMVKP